jgi:exosortase A-associated hydrolase 1
MRRMIDFDCGGEGLVGTLDEAEGTTGLLIVSGGNEIRSGAHAGQAAMAQHFAATGHPVFRYDRRGIGDSEGENGGFESCSDDLAAAVETFRAEAPHITRLVAFGNCDAATALIFFHDSLLIDALVVANPWVIEAAASGLPNAPPATAIRARYWARLKNPRSLIDLLTGRINLKKLASGIMSAARPEQASGLANQIAATLAVSPVPVTILVARGDTTAMAFMARWHSALFGQARARANVALKQCDTASHSFADIAARTWLYSQVAEALSAT